MGAVCRRRRCSHCATSGAQWRQHPSTSISAGEQPRMPPLPAPGASQSVRAPSAHRHPHARLHVRTLPCAVARHPCRNTPPSLFSSCLSHPPQVNCQRLWVSSLQPRLNVWKGCQQGRGWGQGPPLLLLAPAGVHQAHRAPVTVTVAAMRHGHRLCRALVVLVGRGNPLCSHPPSPRWVRECQGSSRWVVGK